MRMKSRNYVSCKIRTLPDLVLSAGRLPDSPISQMEDCVNPHNFNFLCEAVRQWSKFSDDTGECGTGSVPRRLFKPLKVCSDALWTEAIKSKDLSVEALKEKREMHEKFGILMGSDWALEVNVVGDNTIRSKMVEKMLSEKDIDFWLRNEKIDF